jgi:hypothetical protein
MPQQCSRCRRACSSVTDQALPSRLRGNASNREKLQLATSAGLSMMICYYISVIKEYTHEKYFKLCCPFEPTLSKKIEAEETETSGAVCDSRPPNAGPNHFGRRNRGGRIRQGKSPAREWLARAIPIFSVKFLTPKARTHGARVHGAASCCARVYIRMRSAF